MKTKTQPQKKMFAITTDGAVVASDTFTVEEFLSATLNCTLGVLNATVAKTPPEEREQCREAMYDLFNQSASALLEVFIPDKELRPDLTAEAIMKMENNLLDAQSKVAQFKNKGSAKK